GACVYAAVLAACFLRHGAVAPEALEAHTPDDTYYHLQIATNLARGAGSCFSVDEVTNGYHPLWCWLLAGLRRVLPPFRRAPGPPWLLPLSRDALVLLAVVLGAAATALSAIPFARFLAATGVADHHVRFCALVYAVNPWVACFAISGMETGLFLLLLHSLLATARLPARPAPAGPPPFRGAARR